LILRLERLHKARKTNVQLTTTYPISLRAKLAEAKFKDVRNISIIMKCYKNMGKINIYKYMYSNILLTTPKVVLINKAKVNKYKKKKCAFLSFL